MIRRSMDAGRANALANHPEIRPFIGGGGESELDLSPLVDSPSNIFLDTEHGGWLLIGLAPGEWGLHTMFLKSGRGRFYRKASAEALRWMFTRTDCTEILTECPDGNPAARMAAVMAGFRERFVRGETSYQAFTIDDWIARDAEALTVGKALFASLRLEPTDDIQARAVGAAVLMGQGGQVGKGVAAYCRIARFLGYPPIAQVAPELVDLGGPILKFAGETVTILAPLEESGALA